MVDFHFSPLSPAPRCCAVDVVVVVAVGGFVVRKFDLTQTYVNTFQYTRGLENALCARTFVKIFAYIARKRNVCLGQGRHVFARGKFDIWTISDGIDSELKESDILFYLIVIGKMLYFSLYR